MKTEELLSKHPKVTKLIKGWLTEKMIESFKDKNVPEDFKEYMKGETIDDKNLIPIIDANPRFLFDAFDNWKMHIVTGIIDGKDLANPQFWCAIHGIPSDSTTYNNRKDAEREGIERAFGILEKNLEGFTEK